MVYQELWSLLGSRESLPFSVAFFYEQYNLWRDGCVPPRRPMPSNWNINQERSSARISIRREIIEEAKK
jgi:hypothetical protein